MSELKRCRVPLYFAFLLLLGFSCVSCSNAEDVSSLDNYSITEGEILKQQRLYKTSPSVIMEGFKIVGFQTLGWDFQKGSIFFDETCPITYSQLVSFSNGLSLTTKLGNERYKCLGTAFSSYSIKNELSKGVVYYQKRENDKNLAMFLEADLKTYIFEDIKTGESFDIYVSISPCLLTLEEIL